MLQRVFRGTLTEQKTTNGKCFLNWTYLNGGIGWGRSFFFYSAQASELHQGARHSANIQAESCTETGFPIASLGEVMEVALRNLFEGVRRSISPSTMPWKPDIIASPQKTFGTVVVLMAVPASSLRLLVGIAVDELVDEVDNAGRLDVGEPRSTNQMSARGSTAESSRHQEVARRRYPYALLLSSSFWKTSLMRSSAWVELMRIFWIASQRSISAC